MKSEYLDVVDGIAALKNDMDIVIRLITDNAWWVHPETFKALPVWYPEFSRGQVLYDKTWTKQITNTRKVSGETAPAKESNGKAQRTLIAALGARKAHNLTVCHIWGYDDPKFASAQSFVVDRNFYTCVGNMVWLPTPLKGITDSLDHAKKVLKYCALQMYDWPLAIRESLVTRSDLEGAVTPDFYPSSWPKAESRVLPARTAPFSSRVKSSIANRKEALKSLLEESPQTKFPREAVSEILKTWDIKL